MASSKDDAPALLGLPPELLQCIISRLTDESLLPLRLACKSLESAALDRFTTVYLEERNFCLLMQARWNLLCNLASSRLASRLQKIVLTGKVLWNVEQRALPTVGSARWKEHVSLLAQHAAARAIIEEAACEIMPAPELMVQVCRAVRRNAPGARIILDLTCDSSSDLAEERSRQQAMFEDVVVIASRLELPLGALWLGPLSLALLVRLANQEERCVLPASSVSGLRAFVFTDSQDRESVDESQSAIGRPEDRLAVAGNILKSTKELRSLALAFNRLSTRCSRTCRLKLSEIARTSPLQTNLLVAANLSHLESLILENLYIHGTRDFRHLLAALSQCIPTLQELRMCNVYITGLEIRERLGWPDVFQILAVMPKLEKITFEVLGFGSTGFGEYAFFSGLHPYTLGCRGRSEVVAALRQLCSEQLVYA